MDGLKQIGFGEDMYEATSKVVEKMKKMEKVEKS
jgi:hypothetical protein